MMAIVLLLDGHQIRFAEQLGLLSARFAIDASHRILDRHLERIVNCKNLPRTRTNPLQ
jgi:hypothetical protein